MSNPYAPPEDRPRGDEAPVDRGTLPAGGPDAHGDRTDGEPGLPVAPGQPSDPAAPWPGPGGPVGPWPGQQGRPAPWPGSQGRPPAPWPGQQVPPGTGPGPRTESRTAGPEELARIAAGVRLGAALVLGALLVQLLPLPWGLLALPFAVLGTGVVGRTVLRMSRSGIRGPASALSRMLLVVGVVSLVVSLMLAVYWTAGADSYRCEQAALTVQGKLACAQLLPQQGSVHLP